MERFLLLLLLLFLVPAVLPQVSGACQAKDLRKLLKHLVPCAPHGRPFNARGTMQVRTAAGARDPEQLDEPWIVEGAGTSRGSETGWVWGNQGAERRLLQAGETTQWANTVVASSNAAPCTTECNVRYVWVARFTALCGCGWGPFGAVRGRSEPFGAKLFQAHSRRVLVPRTVQGVLGAPDTTISACNPAAADKLGKAWYPSDSGNTVGTGMFWQHSGSLAFRLHRILHMSHQYVSC